MTGAQSHPLADSDLSAVSLEKASGDSPDRPKTALRRMRWVIVIVLCLLPAFIALMYIHSYGVNGVFWDEFSTVPLFEKYYDGTLAFRDFYAQHNEHRLLFPRLVMLPLGLATRFNTVAEMYVGWGFLCLSALPILFCCRRMHSDALTAYTAFIPAAWILFNLRQSENLLWGMQGLCAGVEIALWDIKWRKLGVPMHSLLGGRLRGKIRMYCDCHAGAFWTAEDYSRRWLEVRISGNLDSVYEPKSCAAKAKRIVGEGFTPV